MICLNSAGSHVRSEVEDRGAGPPERRPPGPFRLVASCRPKPRGKLARETETDGADQSSRAPPCRRRRGIEPSALEADVAGPPACTELAATATPRERSSRGAVGRVTDPRTGVVPGGPRDRNVRSRCRCSMCPAIHISSRSWLRSSSTHEPSDPPLRVVIVVRPKRRGNGPANGQQPRSRGARRQTYCTQFEHVGVRVLLAGAAARRCVLDARAI